MSNKLMISIFIIFIFLASFNVFESNAISMNAREIVIPSPSPDVGALAVDFSPDGRYLAASYYKGLILIFDTATYQVIHRINYVEGLGAVGTVTSLKWSPDGSLLAISVGVDYGVGGVAVYKFDKQTQEISLEWVHSNPGPRKMAWSSDGSKLAVAFDYYTEASHMSVIVYDRSGSVLWGGS